MTNEKRVAELKQIYRLRQLQGIIPMNMTFEQYITFLKELYNIS